MLTENQKYTIKNSRTAIKPDGKQRGKEMMYTADNMARMLGSDATDADASRFASYLISGGWELLENNDGQIEAWRNGQTMTEQEWQDALADCFAE